MPVTIDASITLAELVTERPALARELERRSHDYCCGGQRALAEACARQGLDAGETIGELSAVQGGDIAAWATFGPVGGLRVGRPGDDSGRGLSSSLSRDW